MRSLIFPEAEKDLLPYHENVMVPFLGTAIFNDIAPGDIVDLFHEVNDGGVYHAPMGKACITGKVEGTWSDVMGMADHHFIPVFMGLTMRDAVDQVRRSLYGAYPSLKGDELFTRFWLIRLNENG